MALLLLSFSILLLASSGDALHEHASAVSIVGSVLCDRCVHQHESSFLSGATVEMECRRQGRSAKVRVEATSDEYGAFKIEVPSEIIPHSLQLMRGCGVRLLKSPDENCRGKMKGESSSKPLMAMALKSEEGGSYVYTAGSFMFHPTPMLCSSRSRNVGGFKDEAESEMKKKKKKKKKSSSTSAVFPFLPLPPLVIPPLLIPPPPPSLPPLPFLNPPLPLFPFPPLLPLIPPILPPLPFIPPLPPLPPSQLAHSQPTSP